MSPADFDRAEPVRALLIGREAGPSRDALRRLEGVGALVTRAEPAAAIREIGALAPDLVVVADAAPGPILADLRPHVRHLPVVVLNGQRDDEELVRVAAAARVARASHPLAELVDACPTPMFAFDADGRVLCWNPPCERLFCWPRPAILGRRMSDTALPADPLRSGNPADGRVASLARRRDGRRLPVDLSMMPWNEDAAVTLAWATSPGPSPAGRLLAHLVAQADHALIGVDPAGRVLSWNPGAEHLTGWSPEEVLSRPLAWLWPEERSSEPGVLLERLRLGEEVSRSPAQLRHRRGGWIDTWLSALPAAAEEGRDRGGFVVALEAARHATDLAAQVPVGMHRMGPDGSVIWANPAMLRMLGCDATDFVGRPFRDFLVDPSAVGTLDSLGAGSPPVDCEIWLRRLDGAAVCGLLSAQPLPRVDGATEIVCMTRDITDRKRAEEQLRGHAARLRLVLGQLPAAVWTTDADRRVTSTAGLAPPALAVAAIGSSEEGGLRRDADVFRRAYSYALNGRSVHFETTAGETCYDCHIEPLHDERGFVVGTIAIAVDITERARRERELQQLNERLDEAVHARTSWISLLADLSRAANEADSIPDAFDYALRRLCAAGPWTLGLAWEPLRRDPTLLQLRAAWCPRPEHAEFRREMQANLLRRDQDLPGRVLRDGQVRWTSDLDRQCPARAHRVRTLELRSAIAFPVTSGSECVAVLELFSELAAPPADPWTELLTDVGLQLGRVVERVRMRQWHSEVVCRERQLVTLELHDNLAQELTGLAFIAESAGERLREERRPEASRLAQLSGGLRRALDKVKQLCEGLSPVDLVPEGLLAALDRLVRETESTYGLRCVFEHRGKVHVHDNLAATHLYFIAQEAVLNAVKHARARRIVVSLRREGPTTELTVRDNGVGLPESAETAETAEGMGLRIMKHRAAAIEAALKVERDGARGTIVTCTLRREPPWDAHEPASSASTS